MAYTSNVPQASQTIAQTQPIINANFQALAPWGNGYGDFSLQVSRPSTTGTDFVMYNYTSPTTSNPTVYLQTNSANPVPLNMQSNSGVNGWAVLPSGLLIKWGQYTISSDSAFPTINPAVICGGPQFVTPLSVQVTGVYASASTKNTFTCGVQSGFVSAANGSFIVYCNNSNTGANQTYINFLVLGLPQTTAY